MFVIKKIIQMGLSYYKPILTYIYFLTFVFILEPEPHWFWRKERCGTGVQQCAQTSDWHSVTNSWIHLHKTRDPVHLNVWVIIMCFTIVIIIISKVILDKEKHIFLKTMQIILWNKHNNAIFAVRDIQLKFKSRI